VIKESTVPLVAADTLEQTLRSIYLAKDVPVAEAAIVASHQTKSNLVGHDSHGAIRTATYVERIDKGHIVPGARFEIEEETPATAVINGNWGFGFVQTERAMSLAIEKARGTGVAAVTIRYQGHMGRLGAYMEMATEAGMLGLMAADSGRGPKSVVPLGGRVAKLGTNPISFGVPTGGPPLILDMATSAVAGGKVQLMRAMGRPLEEGWLLDAEGRPSTDPDDYYEGGALLPFGGGQAHKGYGLSVIVEILCGVLTGLGFGVSADARHNDGNFIAVFDVSRFRDPDVFRDDVDAFIADLKSTPLAEGHDEIFYPGEIEARTAAQRSRAGILLDDRTWGELVDLSERLGLPDLTTG
jgi:LDH2 family malate/lactate/ureidoglycolate dehydrogenase